MPESSKYSQLQDRISTLSKSTENQMKHMETGLHWVKQQLDHLQAVSSDVQEIQQQQVALMLALQKNTPIQHAKSSNSTTHLDNALICNTRIY